MRITLLIVLILSSGLPALCQSVNQWFFGFTLDEEPSKIQNALDTDARFQRISRFEKPRRDSTTSSYIFLGRTTVAMTLHNQLYDSASILLTAGYSHGGDVNYVGYIKNLRAEYFFSNGNTPQQLFEEAVKELSKGTSRKQRRKLSVGTPDQEGRTIWITYVDNSNEWRQVKLWQTLNPKTKVCSLLIDEWRSDN
jgi:hypothetical protein